MKLPQIFRKKSQEKVTLDWPHQYVIHEVKYAFPDYTTTPGCYRSTTRDDFRQTIEQAIAAMDRLDLGPDQRPFEQGVRLRALELLLDLNETRMAHHRQAIRLRSEAEGRLGQQKVRCRLLKERLAQLDAETEKLCREGGTPT